MSAPVVTLALSEDGHSMFVYRGDSETGELEACVGTQREDYLEALANWVTYVVSDETYVFTKERP